MLSRKQIMFASLQKSLKITSSSFWAEFFYTAFSIQFLTCHMFWVFLFELHKCTWKINLYNLSSFGRLSKCVLTALISLWEVMYEGSFQVCDGRWWKKILECQKLKLGDAPETLKKYSRRLKRLSLGMPPCIHFFINNYQFVPRCTIFLSLHASCAMIGASLSLLFLVSLALLVVHNKLYPSFILCGRETRST